MKERNTYLVEHYRPGLTVEVLGRWAGRVRQAAEAMERDGKPVRYVRSTIVPADESLLCLIEAATEELVNELYARAGIPFERVSTAIPDAGEGDASTLRRRRPPGGAGGPGSENGLLGKEMS
jgi:hypothetical protein